MKPGSTATTDSSAHWSWRSASAWVPRGELRVDRNDGQGFVLLAIASTPNYTDTLPLPAQNTEWKYKAIYRDGEAQFGLESEVVGIAVRKP